MQISIKKTADENVSKYLIEELQKTIGKEDPVMVEVLDLLNEAADKLESKASGRLDSHNAYSGIYDGVVDLIKMIGDATEENDIVEINTSEKVEDDVQEEIEDQKKDQKKE